MEIPQQAQDEITARLVASANERARTRQYLEEGELLKADTPERVEKRKVRLLANRCFTPDVSREIRADLAGHPVREASEEAQRAFESQIEGKETQHCWFLTRGSELRRSVGRIHIRNGNRRIGWGTGFLVAPNLLLTNQHVLRSREVARASWIEFDFEETYEGTILSSATFDLRPDILYLARPAEGDLDYALVAVAAEARSDSSRPQAVLTEFGHHMLVSEEGKLLKGESINIIHHPEGQARQVSLRANRLMALNDPVLEGTWMHYETDTETGSSGAPLYNDHWEVVGIHHSGVEKRDEDGRILARDGSVWTPEMGRNQKAWKANEGLRVSDLLLAVEDQVKDILDSNETVGPNHVVTEMGAALVRAMLESTQIRIHPTLVPVIPSSEPLLPRPRRTAFNPD